MTYKTLSGYKNIIDDGVSIDHGYFLPKQPIANKISTPQVETVNMGLESLLNSLRNLSRSQSDRIRNLK